MDTIQKQMQGTSNQKRGLFGFGKQKKLDENKNVHLQDQLKELSDKLNKIDTDLSQVEQHEKIVDTLDVNQNKQQVFAGGLDIVDGPDGENNEAFDSDSNMGRANSIKTRMQKLTNKTFSKASVKNKKRSKSPQNGSVPNLISKHNGDINGHSDDKDYDTNPDECFSSDSSVTDLTRPSSDLTLDLITSHNGSSSPNSLRYDRSNSRTSTLSNLSSPRREIDPSVLAEIDVSSYIPMFITFEARCGKLYLRQYADSDGPDQTERKRICQKIPFPMECLAYNERVFSERTEIRFYFLW